MSSIRDGATLARPRDLFIDGGWTTPSSDAVIRVVDPATEEPWLEVAAAQPADMDHAIASSRAAFDWGPWPRMSHLERATYLRALGDRLRRRLGPAAAMWPRESGILYSTALTELARIPAIFGVYADLATDYPFHERVDPTGGGEFGMLIREPVGVVGAIVPWNSPMFLIAHKVAPALLAGCTVILKAAPEAPAEAYLLAEAAEEVGLPRGVLNVITADRAVSERLVRDYRVDKISFTGSTAAGRRIASLSGERIARVTLELGGKSAAVILDDADIAATANSLAGAACTNAGQVCSSLTRIIVRRRHQEDMVGALKEAFSRMRVGDPFEPDVNMGPLATERQRDRIEGLVAAGIAEGATLACGGSRPKDLDKGFFFEPTVFANVDNSQSIAREEIFGPVLSVIPADSEEHAVSLANDSIYGLNASVFTPDVSRARDIAGRLRCGTVGHNAFRTDFGIAAGGFKQSGLGREGGREGLLNYLETKTMILDADPG